MQSLFQSRFALFKWPPTLLATPNHSLAMNNNNSSEDFWDLDDDDLDLAPPSPAEEPTPEPIEQVAPEPAAASPEPAPTPAPPAEKRKRKKEKGKVSKLSIIEKISLLAVITFLGGVAAWGVSLYYKHAPEGELITFNTDFPVKGDSVTVSEVETWWRLPVREGDDADRGVRLSINLIPCARIKIEDTQDALLWVTFRNGDKDLIGDPINLAISNGKFIESGSEEIEIHSTSGFENASKINAYTNGDITPWSVVVIEANADEEFSSKSDPFLKVRIEAKVPEENEVD